MDQSGHLVKFTQAIYRVHAAPLLLSADLLNFLSSFFPQVCAALAEWDSLKNVSNLVAKRQIYTCASYGEGCSLEKPNDCLRAARQCLSRWWSTCQSSPMSVPSLFLCLLASLLLTFFLLSLFLPPFLLRLLPFLSPAPFFSFSQQTHLLQLPWSWAFYNHSHCSPQSEPIYLLRLPLRIRRFFVSISLYHSSSLPPSSHTCWIDKLSATHTPANRTVVRFCLWQGKAISRLFQSSVITWNVSLSGVCFICLSPWLKPFWETENISYDLLWYKSKLSAVNPIHNYSSVCGEVGKWVLYDMKLTSQIKISCFFH